MPTSAAMSACCRPNMPAVRRRTRRAIRGSERVLTVPSPRSAAAIATFKAAARKSLSARVRRGGDGRGGNLLGAVHARSVPLGKYWHTSASVAAVLCASSRGAWPQRASSSNGLDGFMADAHGVIVGKSTGSGGRSAPGSRRLPTPILRGMRRPFKDTAGPGTTHRLAMPCDRSFPWLAVSGSLGMPPAQTDPTTLSKSHRNLLHQGVGDDDFVRSIRLDQIQRASSRGWHRAVDWQRRRLLRQSLAETINGLYRAEAPAVAIIRGGRGRQPEWIDWSNNRRLLDPIGNSRRPKRGKVSECWNNPPWPRD